MSIRLSSPARTVALCITVATILLAWGAPSVAHANRQTARINTRLTALVGDKCTQVVPAAGRRRLVVDHWGDGVYTGAVTGSKTRLRRFLRNRTGGTQMDITIVFGHRVGETVVHPELGPLTITHVMKNLIDGRPRIERVRGEGAGIKKLTHVEIEGETFSPVADANPHE